MNEAPADAGSYRDPSGRVFVLGDRVLRTVMPRAAADFEFVRSTGVLQSLIAEGSAIAEEQVDPGGLPRSFNDARYVVQHPKLPFISYPYEWCFTALKRAALLHLDIQMRCLEQGVALSDASAYNVQFLGPRPIFIDSLSFRRYREDEFWIGHKQFCEQFLNPLLLRALLGVPHNAWYRGGLEGIPTAELNRLLPLHRKLSWNVLTNVVMPASFQRAATGGGEAGMPAAGRFPRAAMQRMLERLRKWISGLQPADRGRTVWGDYARETSYAADEAERKRALIVKFAAAVRPSMIWDIGCNTGDYAKAALASGAGYAVGFDFDQGALDCRVRARGKRAVELPAAVPRPRQPDPEPGLGRTRAARADRAGFGRRHTRRSRWCTISRSAATYRSSRSSRGWSAWRRTASSSSCPSRTRWFSACCGCARTSSTTIARRLSRSICRPGRRSWRSSTFLRPGGACSGSRARARSLIVDPDGSDTHF